MKTNGKQKEEGVSMKKYLICDLDDEQYTCADFKLCDSLEKSKEITTKTLKQVGEYYFETEEGINDCISWKEVKDSDGNLLSYRHDYDDEENFYVNEIIEIEVKNGDCLLVYHHAYDGVDFNVLKIGTMEECIERIFKDISELDLSTDNDFDISTLESYKQLVFDNGNEWEVWSLVHVKNGECIY